MTYGIDYNSPEQTIESIDGLTPFHAVNFNQGIGFLQAKLNDNQLKPIHDEVDKIVKSNFQSSKKVNNTLAGNIEHEYELKCKEYVLNTLMPLIKKFDSEWGYLSNSAFLSEGRPLVLDGLWVNFQKKYEFNPPHMHSGVLSFVIWLDIPYDIHDEMSVEQSKNAAMNIPGHFQFLYTNPLGRIYQCNIPVDKTYNGTIAIFPAEMLHAVYPFTTSDKYRITVSGNFKYHV